MVPLCAGALPRVDDAVARGDTAFDGLTIIIPDAFHVVLCYPSSKQTDSTWGSGMLAESCCLLKAFVVAACPRRHSPSPVGDLWGVGRKRFPQGYSSHVIGTQFSERRVVYASCAQSGDCGRAQRPPPSRPRRSGRTGRKSSPAILLPLGGGGRPVFLLGHLQGSRRLRWQGPRLLRGKIERDGCDAALNVLSPMNGGRRAGRARVSGLLL